MCGVRGVSERQTGGRVLAKNFGWRPLHQHQPQDLIKQNEAPRLPALDAGTQLAANQFKMLSAKTTTPWQVADDALSKDDYSLASSRCGRGQ
jgi:hypothetical protein